MTTLDKEIHVGDIGTHLVVRFMNGGVIQPVDQATVKQIKLEKPDGTGVAKTGAFVTDGTDGEVEYITLTGDLDQAGYWYIQGYVEMAGGGKWHSKKERFTVWPNIQTA